jgi:hypothetical protein
VLSFLGKFAQFIVAPNNGFIRFQNVHNPGAFLAIRNGQVCVGEGRGHCEFFVNTVGPDIITLKAAHESGGLGFHGNGMPKEAWTVRASPIHQFPAISHLLVSWLSRFLLSPATNTRPASIL